MRDRFACVTAQLIDADPRIAIVLADISADRFVGTARRRPHRVINVGIREQALIGTAAGMSLAGLRPIVHSYAPFLVERPFEQLKLDLSHQNLGAVLVSIGASYDWPGGGYTHHGPGDVALLDTLEGWTVYVPGHPDEVELFLRAAATTDDRVYVRLSEQVNDAPHARSDGRFSVLRTGTGPTVLAVGPMLDRVLAATAGLDVTVLYAPTVRPFDAETLRVVLAEPAVVLVEPYLAGTSVARVAQALADVPHRVLALGVSPHTARIYGRIEDHDAAYGLDVAGLRSSIAGFATASPSLVRMVR
ncbi:transketolase family protein [Phytoactinopolyspora halotolerans]|uniref:Transketolase n=1 Tax=Phytoactinopolyspora halotolerans TaxID=1981512 RepID=A0A6L9S1H4_9ACTN|nr:transketolase C-terminal domain-containing protein [Phytoactinopolyspora halotolerans]NED99055.1 transketolase [Phytoactinopolyspora halotolerans]